MKEDYPLKLKTRETKVIHFQASPLRLVYFFILISVFNVVYMELTLPPY